MRTKSLQSPTTTARVPAGLLCRLIGTGSLPMLAPYGRASSFEQIPEVSKGCYGRLPTREPFAGVFGTAKTVPIIAGVTERAMELFS